MAAAPKPAEMRFHAEWQYQHRPLARVWSLQHFRDRLSLRQVSEQEVVDTLSHPDKTYHSRQEGRLHICRRLGNREIDLIAQDGLTINGKAAVLMITVMVHTKDK